MKKTLIITLVAIATLALASSAFAVIAGSHHDMGRFIAGSTISSCEYCHTPHNAQAAIDESNRTPLWNRSNPTSTFTGYGLTVSGTTIGNMAGDTNPNTMTCMSCHDGVSAVGTTLNSQATDARNIQTLVSSNRAEIGVDLSNDHPVGFVFVPGNAGVPADVFAPTGPFRLYGATETFQCASCHDPHDTSTGNVTTASSTVPGGSDYFLRADWATICHDCHADK